MMEQQLNEDCSTNCPICLDSLSTSPMGVSTPCGHCFHRTCFEKWAVMSTDQTLKSTYGKEFRPKCPTCNAHVTQFVPIYINTKQNNEGDVTTKQQRTDETIMTLKQQISTFKEDVQTMQKQATELSSHKERLCYKLECQILDNKRMERTVQNSQSQITSLQKEFISMETAKQESIVALRQSEVEFQRRLSEATSNSFTEVKEIMKRNELLSKKYESVLLLNKRRDERIQDLQKENFHLKKKQQLTVNVNNDIYATTTNKATKKPNIRKIAQDYIEVRRQMELEQSYQEKKEEKQERKQMQMRMMKQSSSQASRVFQAATTKQRQKQQQQQQQIRYTSLKDSHVKPSSASSKRTSRLNNNVTNPYTIQNTTTFTKKRKGNDWRCILGEKHYNNNDQNQEMSQTKSSKNGKTQSIKNWLV